MENEKRLIEADAFLQWLVKRFKCIPLVGSCDNDSESMKLLLAQAPTVDAVDAVEVVRCKDCKHWNELKGKDSGKPVGYGDCRNGCGINGIAYEDSFCSYGERRTDG